MGICWCSQECKHDFDVCHGKIFCRKCGKQEDLPESNNTNIMIHRTSIPSENDVFGEVPNNPSIGYKISQDCIKNEQIIKYIPKDSLHVNIHDIPNIKKESIVMPQKGFHKELIVRDEKKIKIINKSFELQK